MPVAGYGRARGHLRSDGTSCPPSDGRDGHGPRRVGVLRERFPGITVVHADAASIRLPGRPFRVVANPPYGISSRLLRTLLAPNSGLVAADLVLQRALVCKFASRNARRFTLTVGLMLPRRAFLPPPHVDSAVLVVRRRKCGDWQGR